MASGDDLLSTVLQLPPEERARIAHKLIASLDLEPADGDADESWVDEIERRAAEGDVDSEHWASVRDRALASLARRS